jgi:hypothetical protein
MPFVTGGFAKLDKRKNGKNTVYNEYTYMLMSNKNGILVKQLKPGRGG